MPGGNCLRVWRPSSLLVNFGRLVEPMVGLSSGRLWGRSRAFRGGDEMSLTGGCFCGRIRYRITAPIGGGRSCHCSRCRKAFSGSASAYAEVTPGSFEWVSGEENLSQYESTPGWGLYFCSTCGTTLCGMHQGQVHGVTLGTVDGDPGVQIEMHIFVGSKARWDHIGGNAPQHTEFPPAVDSTNGAP
jgi:hypothetical protein